MRHPLVEEVDAVVVPTEVVLDEVLVALLAGPVEAPIDSVEVDLHRTPGRGHALGLQGELTVESVLDLVLPTRLPPIAEVEVAEFRDVRLGRKHGVLQGACPLGLEVEAERTLGLRPGPSAVNLQIKPRFRDGIPVFSEPLEPALLGPGLPEVGPHVGIVVCGVRTQHVDAGLPIPQVVGVGDDADPFQRTGRLGDEICPVHRRAGDPALGDEDLAVQVEREQVERVQGGILLERRRERRRARSSHRVVAKVELLQGGRRLPRRTRRRPRGGGHGGWSGEMAGPRNDIGRRQDAREAIRTVVRTGGGRGVPTPVLGPTAAAAVG